MDRGGITYEADPKHREILMEYFGFKDSAAGLVNNGDKTEKGGGVAERRLGERRCHSVSLFSGASKLFEFGLS